MSRDLPRLRVLVVDDERAIADSLAMIFRHKGFDASAEYSGEGAIQSAYECKPDVLISDVVMQGMNGFETARRVCKVNPACRVLLISGQALTLDLASVANVDYAYEIMNKPVPPQVLIDYVEKRA